MSIWRVQGTSILKSNKSKSKALLPWDSFVLPRDPVFLTNLSPCNFENEGLLKKWFQHSLSIYSGVTWSLCTHIFREYGEFWTVVLKPVSDSGPLILEGQHTTFSISTELGPVSSKICSICSKVLHFLLNAKDYAKP